MIWKSEINPGNIMLSMDILITSHNCVIAQYSPLIINTCSSNYRLSPSGIAGRGLWLRCTAERHCSCEPPRGSRTSPAWSRQPRRSRTSSRRPRCLLPAQRPADRSRTPHGRHRGTGGTPAEGKTCPENAHGKISLKVRAALQQEEASGRNKKRENKKKIPREEEEDEGAV